MMEYNGDSPIAEIGDIVSINGDDADLYYQIDAVQYDYYYTLYEGYTTVIYEATNVMNAFDVALIFEEDILLEAGSDDADEFIDSLTKGAGTMSLDNYNAHPSPNLYMPGITAKPSKNNYYNEDLVRRNAEYRKDKVDSLLDELSDCLVRDRMFGESEENNLNKKEVLRKLRKEARILSGSDTDKE